MILTVPNASKYGVTMPATSWSQSPVPLIIQYNYYRPRYRAVRVLTSRWGSLPPPYMPPPYNPSIYYPRYGTGPYDYGGAVFKTDFIY